MDWVDRLLSSPVRDGLQLTAQFAEQRHRVLAENLANIDTPDFQSRRLGGAEFQKVLREAFKSAGAPGGDGLELRGSAQVQTDAAGRLQTAPVAEPAENVLFHDGTNARIERLVSQIHENALTYRFAMTQLRSKFDGLKQAITGRVS